MGTGLWQRDGVLNFVTGFTSYHYCLTHSLSRISKQKPLSQRQSRDHHSVAARSQHSHVGYVESRSPRFCMVHSLFRALAQLTPLFMKTYKLTSVGKNPPTQRHRPHTSDNKRARTCEMRERNPALNWYVSLTVYDILLDENTPRRSSWSTKAKLLDQH